MVPLKVIFYLLQYQLVLMWLFLQIGGVLFVAVLEKALGSRLGPLTFGNSHMSYSQYSG